MTHLNIQCPYCLNNFKLILVESGTQVNLHCSWGCKRPKITYSISPDCVKNLQSLEKKEIEVFK